MRILHLEASSGWGGQEMRILRESEGMRSRGHEVIFGVQNGALLAFQARASGFVVHEMNFKRSAWGWTLPRLIGLMKKVDVVNTHSSLDAWIGGIAARLTRKKIVRTRHLSGKVKPGLNSRILYGKLADFVVTTCESIIAPIAEQSRKPIDLFRSIATGVDPAMIQASEGEIKAFREKIGGEYLVGTACFMRSWKGIGDFLKAASMQKDIRWIIIGGGHEETYRKMAKEMGVDVYFTGHLKNPFPALAALDAFALLSTANEGISQAILQAAYLKKPLIATPVGGSPEVCIDGKTGIQVPTFSPDAVVKAVKKLKENRELSRFYGNNAHELVMDKFTFAQTLDEMEKVFKGVL